MLSTGSSVLKRDNAKVAGQRLLGQPASAGQSALGGKPNQIAQARIVEIDGDCALIEVRCGCGNVIQLNCTLADPSQQLPDA